MWLLCLSVQAHSAAAWFSRPRNDGGSVPMSLSALAELPVERALPQPLSAKWRMWQQCQRDRQLGQSAQDTAAEVITADVRQPLRRPWRLRRADADDTVQLVDAAVPSGAQPSPRHGSKKRVLMLISDTGGGHRASAQALESMLDGLRPGETDVRIVDVFTEYCPWPYNKFVPGYQVMATHSWMWKYSWHATAITPIMHSTHACVRTVPPRHQPSLPPLGRLAGATALPSLQPIAWLTCASLPCVSLPCGSRQLCHHRNLRAQLRSLPT